MPTLTKQLVARLKKKSYCDNEGVSFGPMRKGWNYAVIQIRVEHQGRGYSISHGQQEVRNSLLKWTDNWTQVMCYMHAQNPTGSLLKRLPSSRNRRAWMYRGVICWGTVWKWWRWQWKGLWTSLFSDVRSEATRRAPFWQCLLSARSTNKLARSPANQNKTCWNLSNQ